jgi:AraC-like DNA-binding protein
MKLNEKGVLPESNIYFYTPKENSRKLFLTPKSAGYYFCDDNYTVIRNKYSGYFLQDDSSSVIERQYGSYLCLFIKNGKGYVYQNNHRIILTKNDVFLLDCYCPHVYGTFTGSKLEMIWVHFDGPVMRDYFKQIANNANCSVLKYLSPTRANTIYNNLFNIYEKFDQKKGVNDIMNNKYLMIILTEFLQGNSHIHELKTNSWDDLLIYISENIQKPLKPKDLAERMALSPYHFIRQFKKKIGYTPYSYVLLSKIGTASHLLKSSSLSIKEIAYTCGFSSEGSFCNAFKKLIGIWPRYYRGTIN